MRNATRMCDWLPVTTMLLAVLVATPCMARTSAAPAAIVLDGAGPWRDAHWMLGVSEFTSLLANAGYQVQILSPTDLPSAGLAPGVLLAVPSLESLPLPCFKAISAFLAF